MKWIMGCLYFFSLDGHKYLQSAKLRIHVLVIHDAGLGRTMPCFVMEDKREREISNETLKKKNPKLGFLANSKVNYLDFLFPLKASRFLD